MGRIQLEHVTKQFADTVAVGDLSLDIADSEFLVLVGPSGCGKSTTLRCLAGLETPTSGEIYIAGEHMNYKTPQDRDIAMVFQDYALYPHMTVRQNLRFGLEEESGYTDAERDEHVKEVAAMLDIPDLLDRKPGELSGGQQQRVALGRAIVRQPEVFLMDEPLANLDAKLRSEMRSELQQLQQQLDVTTVYVTHNQTEAMTMGDRIAVLNDGRLQQVGEPLELYHTPANRFVAGFIGEPMMNFIEGEQSDSEFVSEYFEYPLTDDLAADAGDTQSLVLGIRPEDIDIGSLDSEADRDDHEFRLAVSVVEPHGNQNVVHLHPPESTDERDVLQAVTAGLRQVTEGDEVVARLDPRHVHLFDAATGTALHNRRLEPEAEVQEV